jgi:hypothetical protein
MKVLDANLGRTYGEDISLVGGPEGLLQVFKDRFVGPKTEKEAEQIPEEKRGQIVTEATIGLAKMMGGDEEDGSDLDEEVETTKEERGLYSNFLAGIPDRTTKREALNKFKQNFLKMMERDVEESEGGMGYDVYLTHVKMADYLSVESAYPVKIKLFTVPIPGKLKPTTTQLKARLDEALSTKPHLWTKEARELIAGIGYSLME